MQTKIGVIGAMQVEIELLISQLAGLHETSVADMTIYEGTLGGTPVAVVRCGVGKVSAAMCTQALIDHYDRGVGDFADDLRSDRSYRDTARPDEHYRVSFGKSLLSPLL